MAKITKDQYGIYTHEPPVMILDESVGIHWGNAPLRNRIMEVKPRYHLFGHSHGGYGIVKQDNIVYSNAALLNDMNHLVRKPRLLLVQMSKIPLAVFIQ